MSSKTAAPATPEEYIEALEEPRRSEVRRLYDLITDAVPDLEPHIESGHIGFGTYHYKYASGREGDSPVIGLASRKRYISLYVMGVEGDEYVAELYKDRLPKADIGKVCVRLKKVEDADRATLTEMIKRGARTLHGAET
jgi:Domain of unknown function (DU1801)